MAKDLNFWVFGKYTYKKVFIFYQGNSNFFHVKIIKRCDLDLTFDLVVLIMNFKVLSRLLKSVRCRRLTLGRDMG